MDNQKTSLNGTSTVSGKPEKPNSPWSFFKCMLLASPFSFVAFLIIFIAGCIILPGLSEDVWTSNATKGLFVFCVFLAVVFCAILALLIKLIVMRKYRVKYAQYEKDMAAWQELKSQKKDKSQPSKSKTKSSENETKSIKNEAPKQYNVNNERVSLYTEMKQKADRGSAEDSYNFAMRLIQDNCKRGMPKEPDDYIAYFSEVIDYLNRAANILPEAKLELAKSYLELAEANRLMNNKAAFMENSEQGLMWFERALDTGKFNEYREDYQTIKGNIEKIKTEF